MKALLSITTLISLFFSLITLELSAQIQVGQDINGDSAFDAAGSAVSMPDENTIAIGAPLNDANADNAGQVKVYSWDGSAWVQKGNDIQGDNRNDMIGNSISMPDPNNIAIGSPRYAGARGQVKVYSWNGSAWVQKGNDLYGVFGSIDRFGKSVCMPDANTLAVGAHEDDGLSTGYVKIFVWNGSSWVQKGNNLNGEAVDDHFGWAVDMPNGNNIIIGAPLNDGNGNLSGSARVFTWNGSTWVQRGIDIDGDSINVQCGYAVQMPDSNTIAVSSPFRGTPSQNQSGQVKVLEWNGSSWVLKGSEIFGEASADRSGRAISMPNSSTIAIGSLENRGTTQFNAPGHIRVYKWLSSNWIQEGMDIDGEGLFDAFGTSVSMPNSSFLIGGAPSNDDNGSNVGQARVFKFCTNTSNTISPAACESYLSPSGKTYTSSNTYTDTIPNAAGCDSIITINLTINSPQTGSITETACFNYNSPSGRYNFDQSGTYSDTLFAAASNGCDSIITIDLTINTVDTAVSLNLVTVTANDSLSNYQWLDCDNSLSPISG